jgi:hypothetical protein
MTISLVTETAGAGAYPKRFGKRERKLLETAQAGASHVCIAAANYTTAGGAAAEAITISGLLATDIATVTLQTAGATPRTVSKAVCSTDTLTITFSGDPSTDHVVAYHVLRALS